MAKGINKVTIIGNLGADPEVKFTANGTAVSNLRVAVGERRKQGNEWVDHTEWIDVVLFNKAAENAGQYLGKGRQVFIEGRMQTRKYEDKNGVTKYRTEVIGNDIVYLGGGSNTEAPRSNGKSNEVVNDLPF